MICKKMNRTTHKILRVLWILGKLHGLIFVAYEDLNTHFESVEINMLFKMGFLTRYATGVRPTEKTMEMTSIELYSIKIID